MNADQPAFKPSSKYTFGSNFKMFFAILRRRITEDQNIQQAAALAYNTLFSLLPTLVLALLVLSIISTSSAPTTKTPNANPDNAQSSSTSPTADAPSTEPVATNIGSQTQMWLMQQLGFDQIKVEVNHQQVDLAAEISKKIENVRKLVQSPGTGAIALIVLIYGAVSLMLVIERAFNAIYRAPKGRPWLRRFTLYTCLFVWGPIGVAGSIALSQLLHQKTDSILHLERTVIEVTSVIASVGVSWLLLLIIYKLIPGTFVRWRSAMIGALVGAILWEAGKYGFGLYLRYSVGTRNWYGNLALVPLFMMWIYLTWHFVLLGLQIAYIHQYFEPLAQRIRAAKTFRIPIADLNWALPLTILLYHRFKEGKPLEPEQAAEVISIPPDVSNLILGALVKSGIAHALDDGRAFSLAKPPETITAQEILDAAKSLCQVTVNETTTEGGMNAVGWDALNRQLKKYNSSYTLPMLAGEAPLPQ